jgi:hypothetical protein
MVFLLQNTGNRGIKNTDRRLEVLEQQNRMLIDQLRQLVDNTNKRGL